MANSVMEWVSSCPNDLDTMVERGNTDKDDDLEDSDIEQYKGYEEKMTLSQRGHSVQQEDFNNPDNSIGDFTTE